MKVIAEILAGGVGSRMGLGFPKQFLEVDGKPILIYTLNNFQINAQIDEILLVCNPEWIDHAKELIDKYQITKVKWIVPGGNTVHDSTRNGIFFLQDIAEPDDYIIIHDAARPILPQLAINDVLKVAIEHGNASLAIPCYETVILTKDGISGTEDIDRSTIMRIQTPQAYKYDLIKRLYEQAEMDNIHDIVYADLVAIHYGERVFFSKGFTNNIKVTRPEDVPLFKSLIKFSDNQLYTFK